MSKRGIKIICQQTVDAIEKVEHGLGVDAVRPRTLSWSTA